MLPRNKECGIAAKRAGLMTEPCAILPKANTNENKD
jgi:hypothetical protein